MQKKNDLFFHKKILIYGLGASGISCLIEGTQQAAKKNLTFTVDSPSDEVMKVIELAFLDKILKIKKA